MALRRMRGPSQTLPPFPHQIDRAPIHIGQTQKRAIQKKLRLSLTRSLDTTGWPPPERVAKKRRPPDCLGQGAN